jgi:Short C-terminal domain/Phospholipase_D-nuclease N-terminal
MSFWDIIWFIFISFAFIAYLMVLFAIVTDLFRDHSASGWEKAIWIVCLIFFPLITALVYLIAKGRHMTDRNLATAQSMQQQQEAYIKQVAGGSTPTDQVAQAKSLLDSGAITQEEFEALKAKALA